MTTELALFSKIISLPPNLKEDVLKYINFLLFQEQKQNTVVIQERKTPKAGFSKVKFTMADDFDAPLDDFKEYM